MLILLQSSSIWDLYNKSRDRYAANAFVSGAVDQVAYVYQKLGGEILDIELSEYQVYAAYEEAVLEYSYLINVHQAKNAMSDLLAIQLGHLIKMEK